MFCNTCLTSSRFCWSQHKRGKFEAKEWHLPLKPNSLTYTKPIPKVIQVSGCQLIKNPGLSLSHDSLLSSSSALLHKKCAHCSQILLLCFLGQSFQSWKSTFPSNRMVDSERSRKSEVTHSKEWRNLPEQRHGSFQEAFFLVLKYLLGHSLIPQMVGRLLLY